jgi:hypothetical protein
MVLYMRYVVEYKACIAGKCAHGSDRWMGGGAGWCRTRNG